MNPEYPVYIISKGRWESRTTARTLERLGMPYKIVVEPQEYEKYADFIESDNILTLPFSNLEQGSIPARNWVWEHALTTGAKRHWILDDNIEKFERQNKNKRGRVTSGTIFKCAEDFVDRYTNVALAGFEYCMFGTSRRKKPAYRLNARIYSCILIKNDIPYRWRGKFNEDTDLSIRVLKDGYCTILFNAFLQGKVSTMRMKGGNTDLYNKTNNRKEFAESLQKQHPEIVQVVKKFGRWHHHVDYSGFSQNKLEKKLGLEIPKGINNYGMKLVEEVMI